ncbi:MAG: VanZ family protein [Coriobacteriales bacterium]|jgi:VanZ family protein|nr:VanZ family protein [Coriobacteriales bacterium]
MNRKSDKHQPKAGIRLIAVILALAWAVLIFVLSSIPGDSYPPHPGFLNYIAHAGEYLILAALLTIALYGGKDNLLKVAMIALIVSIAYAASDEIHQMFVPNRVSDIIDWLCDSGGAVLGAIGSMIYLRFWPNSNQGAQQDHRKDELNRDEHRR